LDLERALPHLTQKDLANAGFEKPHSSQIHGRPLSRYARILGTARLKTETSASAVTNISPNADARTEAFSVSVSTMVDVVEIIAVIEFSIVLFNATVCVRY